MCKEILIKKGEKMRADRLRKKKLKEDIMECIILFSISFLFIFTWVII